MLFLAVVVDDLRACSFAVMCPGRFCRTLNSAVLTSLIGDIIVMIGKTIRVPSFTWFETVAGSTEAVTWKLSRGSAIERLL
jgi:hypothetical protein